MPQTTTKKKSMPPKSVGLEKRVSALEEKLVELDEKVDKAIARGEQIKRAIAEGRVDTL
jgi:hypothetical protein